MRFSLLGLVAIACSFLFAGVSAAGDKPGRRPACVCDNCTCGPDQCPGKCPLQLVSADPLDTCPNCPNGRCPATRGGTTRYSITSYPSVQTYPSAPVTCGQCQPSQGFFVKERPVLDAVFPNRPGLIFRR